MDKPRTVHLVTWSGTGTISGWSTPDTIACGQAGFVDRTAIRSRVTCPECLLRAAEGE